MDVNLDNHYNNPKKPQMQITKDDKLEYIKQVLKSLQSDCQRLKNAKEKRKQLLQLAKSGVAPVGVKIDWIKKTAKNILKLIEVHIEEFNTYYGNDIITSDDLVDLMAHLQALTKDVN